MKKKLFLNILTYITSLLRNLIENAFNNEEDRIERTVLARLFAFFIGLVLCADI